MRWLIAVVLGLLWYSATAVYVAAQTPAPTRALQTADAAIVLGAAAWGERPSPVLRSRIDHAVQLYRDGRVRALIFTGGVGLRSRSSEAAVAARYALDRGVPAEAILLEERSTNTVENLLFARDLAAQHGLDEFLIVSTASHMRRALFVAGQLEMQAAAAPVVGDGWLSRATRTHGYIRETFGYLAYRLLWPAFRSPADL